MRFSSVCSLGLVLAFSCHAAEQEVLISTDFVLRAGASEVRTFNVGKPEHLDQLVMVGFNPVKALSVDCTISLYGPGGKLLGTYSCHQQQNHQIVVPAASSYKARIEVSNLNFTTSSSSFSVLHRFKFVSSDK